MLYYSLKFSMIQLFLFGLIAVMTEVQNAQPLFYFCSNVTTFARNSTYQTNRDTLLTNLASNTTSSAGFYSAGFYSAFVGQDPNEVNGLFLCRGDVSTTYCRTCVTSAVQEIVQLCPDGIWAIVWYDNCLLRYSNESIFFTVDTYPVVHMWNPAGNITTDQLHYNQVVNSSLNDVIAKAASVSYGAKNFAVNQTDLNGFQTVYSLAQCTPDLLSEQCDRCLRLAMEEIPISRGGRVIYPSCQIRYEVYLFYNATATAPPPSSPPATAPSPPSLQPASPAALQGKSGISSVTIVAIVVPIAVSAVLFWLVFCFLCRRHTEDYHPAQEDDVANDNITTTESLQFDLGTLVSATNNFSADNKLGEGGFGEVYKGSLPNGKDIAVKKLSRGSRQGAKEFKTEAALLAKLQHRSLVTLLGFCLEGGEKILVYEFVPNKSLDYFLFDPAKLRILDWVRRYKIIRGIARGILYLHEDSRLRIIHRDLKASNVLLDADMNPKISDFGTARIFGVEQTHENTNRIVGTYGYMAPEYAMHGMFSVKSDAYSFGVLVLEIICGKKNSSFYQTDGEEFLLSYVWRHWIDGTPLEVLDPTLRDRYSRNDVVRCIQIGLLCVQEDPADRPSMATVVHMLNNDTVIPPVPQRPAFFINGRTANRMPSKAIPRSVDSFITEIHPR